MRNARKRGAAGNANPGTGASAPGVSGDNSDGGYNAGMAVFSYIIGGIIVWSLIGWGLDYLWGTRWIVLAGALLGAVGGFYLSHMHGLTSSRKKAGDRPAASGPSKDGDTNAK
ncbi:AtpZ/AtpI family protein [Arthrobacter sp. MAHUQ-56]